MYGSAQASDLHLCFCFSSCFCPLPHGVETSFSCLLRHILSASSSLDLCVFSFSNMDLSRAVLLLHSKGVTVRVLSDKHYSAITGSQIGALRKAGKRNTVFTLFFCTTIKFIFHVITYPLELFDQFILVSISE